MVVLCRIRINETVPTEKATHRRRDGRYIGRRRFQARSADILLTISDGTNSQSIDTASNNVAIALINFDGSAWDIETTVTDYPGSSGPPGGYISTNVNVNNALTSAHTISLTVQLVQPGLYAAYNTAALLTWNAPTISPVTVSAATSFTPNTTVSSAASVTTTTYYDSPPAATLQTSTPAVSTTEDASDTSGPNLTSVSLPNASTYTLSQVVTLANINTGAAGFNFGGTSSVTAPEPSSMAIAGLARWA